MFDKETAFRIRIRKPDDSIFMPNSYVKVALTEYKIENAPPGISLILKRKKGTTELIAQSIEFNQSPLSVGLKIWTVKEAKEWAKHNKPFLLKFSLNLEEIAEKSKK